MYVVRLLRCFRFWSCTDAASFKVRCEALHLPLNNHCDDRCCRCCIQAALKFSVGGVLDLCPNASSMLT